MLKSVDLAAGPTVAQSYYISVASESIIDVITFTFITMAAVV